MKLTTTLLLIPTLLALISCTDNAKMRKMSNVDIAAKSNTCIRKNPSSPGRVTACENIRKECERRRKEGNFAC